jgi:hypothetical protein
MKKLALFFMTTTVAFATVCLLQSRKLASQQEQLTSLNAQSEQKSEEDESLRASEKSAREEAQELQRVTVDLTAQLAAHQQPEGVVAAPKPVTTGVPFASVENQVEQAGSTKPIEDQSGFSGFLSKMMNDPESRKFIRDQQRMIMDQLYAPLVKQLALSPDESEKFKDLLADNTMKGAENASSLFAGDQSNAVVGETGLRPAKP